MANNRPIYDVPIRAQSGLSKGRFIQENNPSKDNNNLEWGIVTRIDYANAMIEYMPIGGQNQSNNVQGLSKLYQAELPVSFYGTTVDNKVFGNTVLIQTGNTVLLGNVGGNVNSRVVIGVYPDRDNRRYDELTSVPKGVFYDDSVIPLQDMLWQKQVVYPSQQTELITGDGQYARTFDGDSFLQVATDDLDRMASKNYSLYTDNAFLANSKTGMPRKPNSPIAPNMLLVHKNGDGEEDTHVTSLLIDKQGQLTVDANMNTPNTTEATFQVSATEGISLTSGIVGDDIHDVLENSSLTVDEQGVTLSYTDSSNQVTSLTVGSGYISYTDSSGTHQLGVSLNSFNTLLESNLSVDGLSSSELPESSSQERLEGSLNVEYLANKVDELEKKLEALEGKLTTLDNN